MSSFTPESLLAIKGTYFFYFFPYTEGFFFFFSRQKNNRSRFLLSSLTYEMYPFFVHFIEPLPEQWRRNGTTTFFADTKSNYAPKNEQRWHQTTSLALNVVQ